MSSYSRNWLDKLVDFVYQYEFHCDEVFREIVKYSSRKRYFVSNYGVVVSLYYNRWRIIKPSKDKDGYLFVSLWYNGKRIHKGIHQLVAECFIINPDPKEKTQIHHKDFNILNNKASNLIYLTPKEHREIHNKHNKEVIEVQLNANRKNCLVSS